MAEEKAKVRGPRVPMTRKIDRKTVAFDPGLASDLISLQSLPFVIDSFTVWARQLGRMACPGCNVVGSIRASIETYGVVLECRRGDRGACDYQHEQLFSNRAE